MDPIDFPSVYFLLYLNAALDNQRFVDNFGVRKTSEVKFY